MPMVWSTRILAASTPRTIDDIAIKDFALDRATGDLALDENHSPYYVTGADAIAQRLTIRYRMWLGEWFLDERQGIPYIEKVFVKAPKLALIERLFRRVTTSTPGIQTVKSFDMAWGRAEREVQVTNLEAVLVSGDTLIASSSPFILDSRA
jgi:hypothetical protein